MSYNYILFDLDGTLTDPKIGITKSVAYALDKLRGIQVNPDTLVKFIGPPLKESFMAYYGFEEAEAIAAVESYREYFKVTGIYENAAYDGIEDLLARLVDQGRILAVATSKPTVFAEIILKHFGLEGYFTVVVGSELDGRRTNKAEVIDCALQSLGVKDLSQAVMVGDREHDMIGAQASGIDAIGVEYGYGSRQELEESGATAVVKDIAALARLLTKQVLL